MNDIDDLVDSATGTSRHETDPSNQPTARPDLATAVADALEAIDAGDAPNLVSVRDDNLSALLQALDETDRLQDVVDELAHSLDRDVADANRSDLVRMAIRYAVSDVAADVLEEAREGRQQYLTESEDDF